MTRSIFGTALAAISLASASVAVAPAQAAPAGFDAASAAAGDAHLIPVQNRNCFPGERSVDCRERFRVEQHSHRNYVYRNGHYEDNSGNAVVGAIFGFALGAAIAGSQQDHDYYYSHRNDRGWRARCRSAYGNFDYHTGTYMGDDGYRHYCTR